MTILRRHVEREQDGIKRCGCLHCQYRNDWKGHLQKHIDTVHEALKKFECPHVSTEHVSKATYRHTLTQCIIEGLKKFG